MKSHLIQVAVDALYLLALINPISKVSVLSAFATEDRRAEFVSVTAKCSVTAGAIFLGSMVFGDFVLRSVFHVELHSLSLAGGVVLFWVGFHALQQGVFFEQKPGQRFEEMAFVPLACPMIAGPASITACIALRAREGLAVPVIAMTLALLVNYAIMRLSSRIATFLARLNVLGALIRITGLVVMTIGTQMALDGVAAWWLATSP